MHTGHSTLRLASRLTADGTSVYIAEEGNDRIRMSIQMASVTLLETGRLTRRPGWRSLRTALFTSPTPTTIESSVSPVNRSRLWPGMGRRASQATAAPATAAQLNTPVACRGRFNRPIPLYRGSDQQQDPKSRLRATASSNKSWEPEKWNATTADRVGGSA